MLAVVAITGIEGQAESVALGRSADQRQQREDVPRSEQSAELGVADPAERRIGRERLWDKDKSREPMFKKVYPRLVPEVFF